MWMQETMFYMTVNQYECRSPPRLNLLTPRVSACTFADMLSETGVMHFLVWIIAMCISIHLFQKHDEGLRPNVLRLFQSCMLK